MAAPNYTEDLTDITLAESTLNWSALGGGASGLAIGPDFAMQGTNCVDKQVSASEKGQIYNNGATITPGTNTHFFIWAFLATPGVADSLQNRGLGIVLGTTTTAYNTFHVEGNDTYGAVGRVGKCYPIRYVTSSNGSAPYRTLTGSPGANPQYFGATANITGTVKSSNLGVDAIRYGTGIYITAGDSGDPATFAGAATQNDASLNRWGILTKVGGTYELQGRFVIGQNNAGTPTAAYFSDANSSIAIVDTPHTLTDFTQIIVDHASTEFTLRAATITALGTNNPGRLVFNNASTIGNLISCNFTGLGITTLRAGVTATGTTWRNCGQITANSAVLDGCVVTGYTGATDTSALVWDTAVDPDGYIDGTTFIKGAANSNHAIEFGTTSPTTMTLRDVFFSGYSGSNAQNDSAIHIKRTTGTVTINIVGGTTPSYKSDGATVVIVAGTLSVSVNVKNSSTGANIQDARVLVAANASGAFPYNASVSLSKSVSTVTVTHTGHGLSTNDKVLINGANQPEYNGVFTITVTGVNTYEYTISGSPAAPTGTITSTFVFIQGLTDASGNITMSRSVPSDQSVRYTVRKSSTAPYFKSLTGTATVTSASGLSLPTQLIPDE